MAYGLEYYFEYRDKGNILQRLEILKEGFSDPETLIEPATGVPVILHHFGEKNKTPIIQGQELIFRFFSFVRGEYDDFMVAAYKDRKIKYWQGNTLVFEGYPKPENIVTEKMSDAYVIELSATDALADLREIDFVDVDDSSIINGKYTGLEILKYALEHTGIELDFKIQLGTFESTYMAATDLALNKIEVNSLRFIKQGGEKTEIMSCHAVIETILEKYNCTLSQTDGFYKISNKYELNSYEFLFAWSDLSQTSRTVTNNIKDLTDYNFEKIVEQQKIQPLKRLGVKFRNKDLGGDVTGMDLSDWDNIWTIDFYNYNIVDESVILTSKSSITENNSITLATDFNITKLTDNDYLKISFDHLLFSYTGGDTTHVSIKIEITRPDESVVEVIHSSCYEEWTHFESSLYTTFKIVESGDYNIKLTFIPNPSFAWTWDNVNPIIHFKIKNVAISKVINVEEGGDLSGVTFDQYYVQESGIGIESLEKEFLLADGGQINEVGALLFDDSGTYRITADWRTHGNTEDVKLIDIYARNILNDRYDYKDYLRLKIFDAGDITLNNIIKINNDYYTFVEFTKDFKKNFVSGALVQLLTSRQSYNDIQRTALNSIDGEQAFTSPNVNPVIPQSIAHNDTTGKQGASPYNHLSDADYANVGNLDSMAYVPTTDYYTKANLNAGQLDNRYYTETELNNGQLDNRYYTETEVNTWRNSVTQQEMGWLHGITSDVQDQLTARAIIGANPADNRLCTWSSATTIQGETDLVFTATGLGIGISSPNEKLEVAGKIRLTGTANVIQLHRNPATQSSYIQYYDSMGSAVEAQVGYTGADDIFRIYNLNADSLILGTNSTARLTILSDGKVGINDTTPSYTLDVNGTGRFTGNLYGDANVQHLSFQTGFQGDKWQITEDGNAEFENMMIRGGLTVYELILNRLHYQCGGMIIGAGGGKISVVNVATVGSEQLTFEDPEGNSILPFTVGAIVMIQDFDLNRTTVIKKIVRQVASIAGVVITFTTTTGWLTTDDTGIFAVGDEVVAIGHVSNAALDASIYFSAVDSDNPFMRVFDGVSTYGKWSLGDKTTIKLQLGNLESLASYGIVPAAPGYGLYSDNVYLSGLIKATTGEIGSGGNVWTIKADSIYTGTEHLTDDWSTTGITLANDGSIHAPNFYVNTGGEIGLRQVESVLFKVDGDSQGIIITGRNIRETELDNDASIYVNYYGYNGGTTRYRNTIFGNGQGDSILVVGGKTGTDKYVDITGETTITGTLDVTGTIRSTETKEWSCSGINFKAINPDTDSISYSNTEGRVTADANGVTFVAPVFLPHGATISAVVVYGNGAAGQETWFISRRSLVDASSGAIMATAAINTVDSTISNAVVDNSTYSYFINTTSLDTGDQIYSAKITYTL